MNFQRGKSVFLALSLVLTFAAGFGATHFVLGFAGAGDSSQVTSPPSEIEYASFPPLPSAVPTETVPHKPSASPDVTDSKFDIAVLQEQIRAEISDYGSIWQVYAKQAGSSGFVSCARNTLTGEPMTAASLIKLFIMGTVYQSIYDGKIRDSAETTSDINIMITESSNAATNRLIRLLGDGSPEMGFEAVNEYCDQNGYKGTRLSREMIEDVGDMPDVQNYTTPEDCVIFLERVYNGECVNEEASEAMLELLKKQTRRDKIPTGIMDALGGSLPDSVWIANKTGELSGENIVHGDAAIVFSENAVYIICIMGEKITSNSNGLDAVRKISEIAYLFFNPRIGTSAPPTASTFPALPS